MSSAISRPIPRPPPVITTALPLSIMSSTLPVAVEQRGERYHSASCRRPPAGPLGGQRGDEGGAEDEDDAGVVHEHHERDEDAERAVDLVVDADTADVETEELLGDFPQHGGQDGAHDGGARPRPAPRHVAVSEVEH